MKKFKVILLMILIVSTLIVFINLQNVNPTWKRGTKNFPYIMVNQVGYFISGKKYAIIRTDLDLSNYKFIIEDVELGTQMIYTITKDLGSGYGFKHHYILEFGNLTEGRYVIKLGKVVSYSFEVSTDPFSEVPTDALLFFDLNRCGSSSEFHNACHVDDGIIYNGPLRGIHVNISGGWHDAGDYIKFTSTIAETLIMLEETLIYGGIKNDTKIVDEILWGLDWIQRTWLADYQALIYMVGNRTDHYQGFRLPEDDQLRNRPVYICEPGKGANIAGLVSAALSLGVILQNLSIIPKMENGWLSTSIDVYEFGLQNMEVQQIGIGDWIAYPEYGWQDDMALASILLYKITGNESYYKRSVEYFSEFLEYSDVLITLSNVFAMLHLHEEGFRDATEFYYDLSWCLQNAINDPLFYIFDEYMWSSVPAMVMVAIGAWAYGKTTGDSEFDIILDYVLNYVFGVNQWGVSFVSGYGTVYARNLHHQILYLKNMTIPGILAEGGASKSLLNEHEIAILPPEEDPYSIFQSDEAIYQDVYWNYIVNEPTIRSQAALIFFISVCL